MADTLQQALILAGNLKDWTAKIEEFEGKIQKLRADGDNARAEFDKAYNQLNEESRAALDKLIGVNGATKATTPRAKGTPNQKAKQAIEAEIKKAKNSPQRVKFDASKRAEIAKDCECSVSDVKTTLREHFDHYNPEGKPGAPVWYKMKS